MPHKPNVARRHHIGKMKFKVTNWAKYEAGIRRRGSMTLWIAPDALAGWAALPRKTRGGQPLYSDLAIETTLILGMVFGLRLRQSEGLLSSVLDIMGLDLPVPDHGIAKLFELAATERLQVASEKTLYRYRAAVRVYLDVRTYDQTGESLVSAAITQAASTMSDPADLINRAIEALGADGIDLPAFSTLDRLAGHMRTRVHNQMYHAVAARQDPAAIAALDALLIVPAGSVATAFNRLKHSPGPLRPKTIRQWTERLDWLTGLIDPDRGLEGITHTKLQQFAAEATAMEVRDLLDVSRPGRRHTLLLSLIRQARARCRDELTEMLLRKVRGTQAAARKKLKELQESQRDVEEMLITVLLKALRATGPEEPDAAVGHPDPHGVCATGWNRNLDGAV